jgi:hypothetical protein
MMYKYLTISYKKALLSKQSLFHNQLNRISGGACAALGLKKGATARKIGCMPPEFYWNLSGRQEKAPLQQVVEWRFTEEVAVRLFR